MSIFASACQELSSMNKTIKVFTFPFIGKFRCRYSLPHKYADKTKMATTPAMFSWKITLVPLRKFFPMIKTSSPPLTEQLWRLFFRISGTPAGWAGEQKMSQRIKTHMISELVSARGQEQDSETKETEFCGLMSITVNAVCDKSQTSLETHQGWTV